MAKELREFWFWFPAGLLLGGVIGAAVGIEHFDNDIAGGVVGGVLGAAVGGFMGITIARSRSD